MPPKPLPKRPFCSPTLAVLKKQAAARKIAGRSKMSKAELCKALGYRVRQTKKAAVAAKPKPAPRKQAVKTPPKPASRAGCTRQSTKKYLTRASPPYPANQCCGQVMVGNDGEQYISKPDKRGVCRWTKYRTAVAAPLKPSAPKMRMPSIPPPNDAINCHKGYKCRPQMPFCCPKDTPASGYCRTNLSGCHRTGRKMVYRKRTLLPGELVAIRQKYPPKPLPKSARAQDFGFVML